MTIDSNKFGYPVKHIRKVPFQPQFSISSEINKMCIEIFHLDSELERYILTMNDYRRLVNDAFSSNIHISTKLEGNPLTKADVRRFTKGVFDREGVNQVRDFPRQEIVNHMVAYFVPYWELPWDISTLRNVHDILLHGSSETIPGEFRKERYSIVSSEEEELFIPAPPEHIKEELRSLLSWLNTTGRGLYPVIAGSIFFHEFESIHPFGDGNGRCGRSLFHIFLQKNGLPNSKLCLIEQNIVSDPELYYDILARTDFEDSYERLIHHFVKAVHTGYSEAVIKFRDMDLLTSDLDETSKRALKKARHRNDWFSIQDAKGWFENVSDHIIRNRLNELVERGALITQGNTRGKRYRYEDPIISANEEIQELVKLFKKNGG